MSVEMYMMGFYDLLAPGMHCPCGQDMICEFARTALGDSLCTATFSFYHRKSIEIGRTHAKGYVS